MEENRSEITTTATAQARMKWTRGKKLGQGGFASVYLANMTINPTCSVAPSNVPSLMAVKTSLRCNATSLEEEEQMLSRFRACPDIIRCYGHALSTENNIQFYNLFLEYASGGTLLDRINTTDGRGLPEPEVRRYVRSILQGLCHIHRSNYVHCDIKPDNILLVENRVTGEFKVKIADFGLAMKVGEKKDGMTLRGTAPYVAPECIRENVHEPACDIWALGCSAIEMLSAQYVWGTPDSLYMLLRKITSGTESPTSLPSEVSEDAKDFVNKCMTRDPKLRPTAEELLKHPFVSPSKKIVAKSNNNKDHGVETEVKKASDFKSKMAEMEKKIRSVSIA